MNGEDKLIVFISLSSPFTTKRFIFEALCLLSLRFWRSSLVGVTLHLNCGRLKDFAAILSGRRYWSRRILISINLDDALYIKLRICAIDNKNARNH